MHNQLCTHAHFISQRVFAGVFALFFLLFAYFKSFHTFQMTLSIDYCLRSHSEFIYNFTFHTIQTALHLFNLFTFILITILVISGKNIIDTLEPTTMKKHWC